MTTARQERHCHIMGGLRHAEGVGLANPLAGPQDAVPGARH